MKYVGRLMLDFDYLLETIKTAEPAYVGPRLDKDDVNSNSISEMWANAGHTRLEHGGTTGWDMYFSGKQFDHKFIETVCESLQVQNIASWVSAIHPGNYAPWHYDTQVDETYFNRPCVERYHIHLENWKPGHVFFVGDNALINYSQGDVYKWDSWKDWHAGANAGYSTKYTLNMIVERL